jgi:predicted nucleotidyltransferase
MEINREETIINSISDIARSMADRLKGYRVVLFGSRASGNARERSDFDIGIVGSTPLSNIDFYTFQDSLESLDTLYSIDLVDFSKVSDRFRKNALTKYRILYENKIAD